jgi:uncharacterized coiled-coil protein SlyX
MTEYERVDTEVTLQKAEVEQIQAVLGYLLEKVKELEKLVEELKSSI